MLVKSARKTAGRMHKDVRKYNTKPASLPSLEPRQQLLVHPCGVCVIPEGIYLCVYVSRMSEEGMTEKKGRREKENKEGWKESRGQRREKAQVKVKKDP